MASTAIYIFFAATLALLSLIVYGRKIRGIWLLVWGLVPVVLVYLFNPDFRVYSFHSFMHGGIVYQIINGNIPPPDPLVGGQPAHYPWGFHLVAAGLSRLLGVSPFVSMALLNIASLLATMVLVYRISQLLISKHRAGVLAVVGAVFGSTLVIPEMLALLPDGTPTEIRGIPIIHKFITINPLPAGLAVFLLALYATIRLLQGKGSLGNTLLLFASALAVGFIYPAFMPAAAASVCLGLIVTVVVQVKVIARPRWVRVAVAFAAVVVAGLVLRPYLASIGSGTVSNMEIFTRTGIRSNLLRYIIILAPVMVIVAINARGLAARCRCSGLLAVLTVAAGSAGVYLAIHLPFDNEYKLLLISMVMLGMLGGLAFDSMLDRCRKPVVLILIILFVIPALRVTWLRTTRGRKIPSTHVERGIDIESLDEDDNELYRWIRSRTPPNSIFIDSNLDLPVLGQRQLYIPPKTRGREQQKGYGMIKIILQSQSGYGHDLISGRTAVVERIYDTAKPLREQDLAPLSEIAASLYVIARDKPTADRLDRAGFREVFTSAGGRRIYLHVPAD
jgi:hypothetical protein